MNLLQLFREKFVVKGRYPEISICCVYCDEAEFKLCLNLEKKVGQCFKCGEKLNRSKLFGLLNSQEEDFQESANIQKLQESIDSFFLPKESPKNEELEIDGIKISDFCQKKNPEYKLVYNRAIEYLNSRGFNPLSVSEKYGFLISSPNSRERGRLILPVFEDARIVYYQARSLFGQEPKYLNPPRSSKNRGKSSYIFNIDQASKFEEVIICEGIFSAIAAGDNAIAVFGKELSDDQITVLIKKRVSRITILFDPKTEEFSLKAAEKLHPRFVVRIANLEGGDPNEIPKEVLDTAIKTASLYRGDKIFSF